MGILIVSEHVHMILPLSLITNTKLNSSLLILGKGGGGGGGGWSGGQGGASGK